MFKGWKESRAKQREQEARVQNDGYLRRLRNSADMLSGLQHSGNGEELQHTLEIWEVRAVLREHLRNKVGSDE